MATARYRPTIAGLMALVLVSGLGLAALRNADPYWAAGAYNVAFVALATATVWAVVARGRVRGLATGFALFGWIYLAFKLLPDSRVNMFGFGPQPRPALLIEAGLAGLQPHLRPMSPRDTNGLMAYDQVGQSVALVLWGLFGAAVSGLVAGNPEASSPAARSGGQEARGERS